MKWLALILITGSLALAQTDNDTAESANISAENIPIGTGPGPKPTVKGGEFCLAYQECVKANPSASTMCVRDSLFKTKVVAKKMDVSHAKDMGRHLRREGFQPPAVRTLMELPEGTILVLDSHDPIREKKLACPKVYGNVLVKCGENWIDSSSNPLDFYIKRKCRTKGLWVHPEFLPPGK